jgi:hypothetical protein
MKKQTKSNWQRIAFAAMASIVLMLVANSQAVAQGKYKVGDRVECDTVGNGNGWRKGTVIAFQDEDGYNGYSPDSGYFYRVRIFAHAPEGQFCKSENMRLQAKAAPAENQNKTDGNNENQPQENNPENQALKFKPGDRVECDKAQIDSYEKGTVMPFRKGDFTDGERFRVRLDAQAGITSDGILCKADRMRLLTGEKPVKPNTTVGKVTEDEDGTVSADRPILDCPVEQKPVKNGAAPNPEVIKKVLRCQLGEKPAAKGFDGALTIDISALSVGAARPWDRLRDMGGGTPGKTIVYPVKVTYTEKTFYRTRTAVGENWIYVFNFFVNGFGEWQYGSGEKIKMPDNRDIPRDQ